MVIERENISAIDWQLVQWKDMNVSMIYDILTLRNKVFVVEQHCVYNDTDSKDPLCYHLCGYVADQLIGYARLLPPGLAYDESSIGRVVCDKAFRKKGIGTSLMRQAIQNNHRLWPQFRIKISAQSYLLDFYKSLGFNSLGEEYLEDGIPHREMIL